MVCERNKKDRNTLNFTVENERERNKRGCCIIPANYIKYLVHLEF